MRKPLFIIAIVIAILALSALFITAQKDEKDGHNSSAAQNEDQNTSHQASDQPATTDPGQTDPEDPEEPTAKASVKISNFSYSPTTLTIKKGTEVTWTNQDSAGHTVTSDSGSLLDSKVFGQGESFSFIFKESGTYAYHCAPHPQMKATIVVTD